MKKRFFEFAIDPKTRSDSNRTVEATLSSEYPVARALGDEILSHEPGAVDLSRVPVSLIAAHDHSRLNVGLVEDVRLADRKLRGRLRFGQRDEAEQVWQDVQAGILRHLSVGYEVIEHEQPRNGQYRVTRWQLLEVSIVAVPADPTVGIGRSNERKKTTMKPTMQDLRNIISEMQRLYNIPTREQRDLSGSENIELNKLANRWDQLAPQVDRTLPTTRDIGIGGVLREMSEPAGDRRGNPNNDPQGGDFDQRGRFQVGDDRRQLDPAGGFRSFAHFCHDLYKAGPGVARASDPLREWMETVDLRAAGSPSQSVGDDTSGGVLVPVEFSNDFLDRGTERSEILKKAMVLPMQTNSLDIPFLDGFDESSGKVAGNMVTYWKGEEKQYTASDFKVGKVQLRLNKCTALAFMTDELLRFSPATAEPLLMRSFANAYEKAVAKACLRGNGTGQPLGVLNADDVKIEVAAEIAQPADTLWIENIAKMWARFYSQSESGSGGSWYANKSVMPQLMTMVLAAGTGGSPVFISNVQATPGFSLYGDPLKFSSLMSALGDAGDLAYIDWGQYIIGMPMVDIENGGYRVQQSVHLKFDYDQTTYKFTFYMDGRPWWDDVFTPEYGNTQSPIVTLAERA